MSVASEENVVNEPKPFWTDPGLSEYLNQDNPGFNVKFKATPEDFVVTELLGVEGRHAVLDNFETPEDRSCDSIAFSSGKKAKDNYLAPLHKSEIPLLQDLISIEQYKLVEELALTYKQTETANPIQQINLGRALPWLISHHHKYCNKYGKI